MWYGRAGDGDGRLAFREPPNDSDVVF